MRRPSGLTLGIVGYGRIGRAVAAIGRAFGMRIMAHRQTAWNGPEAADLDTLLRESDVVSLHCPLSPATAGIIGRESRAVYRAVYRAVAADTASAPAYGRRAEPGCGAGRAPGFGC